MIIHAASGNEGGLGNLDKQPMKKTVVMLIGPKGSGKTHIGAAIEKMAGVKFLRVEPIWLAIDEGQDGWAMVEAAIDDSLKHTGVVIIESLGGSRGFERLRFNLEQRYILKYVRIVVSLDVCLERVRTRNSRDHIPVSDENVETYNRIAAKVTLPWDYEMRNEPPMTDEMILDAMKRIHHAT